MYKIWSLIYKKKNKITIKKNWSQKQRFKWICARQFFYRVNFDWYFIENKTAAVFSFESNNRFGCVCIVFCDGFEQFT